MADSLLYPFCYLRIVMSITEIRRPEVTNSPKVGFVSLGCPKALVDSEQILTQLRAEDMKLRNLMTVPIWSSSIPADLLMRRFRSRLMPSVKLWPKTAR
jgi:hypothetical protein